MRTISHRYSRPALFQSLTRNRSWSVVILVVFVVLVVAVAFWPLGPRRFELRSAYHTSHPAAPPATSWHRPIDSRALSELLPREISIELDQELLESRIEWPPTTAEKPYGRYTLFRPFKSLKADGRPWFLLYRANATKDTLESFRIRLESLDARRILLGATSVDRIGNGLYKVQLPTVKERGGGRFRLMVRVEFANLPTSALWAENQYKTGPLNKEPKFRRIEQLYPEDVHADLLFSLDNVKLSSPQSSPPSTTTGTGNRCATPGKYGEPGRWFAYDTQQTCSATDTIRYFSDAFMYSLYRCQMDWFCLVEAHQCLTQQFRRIVLIGDSYVRETYTDLAKLLLLQEHTWKEAEKQTDSISQWNATIPAEHSTLLEYYFAGKFSSLQGRFATNAKHLPSSNWWCSPTMPDVVLLDHGMWTIFIESLDYFRQGMQRFLKTFLQLMIMQVSGCKKQHEPWPRIFLLSMPSTTLLQGYRTRIRTDYWNRELARILPEIVQEINVQLSTAHGDESPLLEAHFLDYYHPTDLRPEASDGNHFGDWMDLNQSSIASPVLSKNNVNMLLNYVCQEQ